MKFFQLLCFAVLFVSSNLLSQEERQSNSSNKQELLGEWTLDLRPTPQSEAYFQPFVVETIEDNSFTGTFYGSPVEGSLLNDSWEKLYFAFTTKDVNNEYYHSGYLLDGKLHGMTYCPNRSFTAPWSGSKK
jgi:hypothetical protein